MKNRLHDKKAGIAILVALIIISLAEIIFRAAALGLESVLTTSNFGEQLAVVVLAATILTLTAKGKDRACYICYGAWIAYFVLDHIFELPGTVIAFLSKSPVSVEFNVLTFILATLRISSMVGIIFIGILLVEYMIDGTIYNKAFNIACIITVAILLISMVMDITGICSGANMQMLLAVFNNAYRTAMVFLFTFFAYDSAKMQLKKVNFSK